ncbi:MAG: hypothetical protein ABIR66_00925 [Saprospiraceae bacterium]
MKPGKILLFLIILWSISCAPKIYEAPDFAKISRKHKLVALLPADVLIRLRPNDAKKMTPEQVSENAEKTGYEIQDAMYSWFLRRSGKLNYTVDFQDITKTNGLLKAAGFQYTDLKTLDREALAQTLGVDAVIQDYTTMNKPMSDGAAIALGLLVGVWGNTNEVKTTINIHDGASGKLIWKYDFDASSSVGTSPDKLVNALMRNASRKFPYQAAGK